LSTRARQARSQGKETIGNSILPLFARWVDGSGLQLILRRRASLS
jgi:hypothetical protein